jgi:hypothetical protein
MDRTPQRGIAKTIPGIDVSSAIDQSLGDLKVASSGGHVQMQCNVSRRRWRSRSRRAAQERGQRPRLPNLDAHSPGNTAECAPRVLGSAPSRKSNSTIVRLPWQTPRVTECGQRNVPAQVQDHELLFLEHSAAWLRLPIISASIRLRAQPRLRERRPQRRPARAEPPTATQSPRRWRVAGRLTGIRRAGS